MLSLCLASMACEMKNGLVLMMIIAVFMASKICVNAKPQVPCFFIFGDSLADNGNNNQLLSLAKVNYKPYGIDFPEGPTGRFTNGRTTVDIIGLFPLLMTFIKIYLDSYIYNYIIFSQYSLMGFFFFSFNINTAELLGFNKYIPAFASLKSSSNLLGGANYASGAAGILRESGKHMVILCYDISFIYISL